MFAYATDPRQFAEWQRDGTRSRVTFALDFEGHGLGVPLIPLVRRQLQKGALVSYRNLKQLLESHQQT